MKRILTSCFLIIIMFGTFLCVPHFTYANPLGSHSYKHFENPKIIITIIDLFFGLNLTDDQKKDIEELIDETRNSITTIRDNIKDLRVDMDETFFSENIDTVKASEQIAKMVALRSQITTAYLNAKLEGVQLLTPEQRMIILNKKNEWRDHFKNLMNPLKLFLK